MKAGSITFPLLTIFFVFNALIAKGQGFAEERWHKGAAVLTNGDTLRGALKYSIKDAALRLKTSNTVQTYSPKKVVFFVFFDAYYRYNRQFYSIPYAVRSSSNYKVPSFFELIRKGSPLTLLSRQTTFMQRIGQLGGAYRRVEQDVFYLLDNKGRITRIKASRRGVYKAFSNYEKAIKNYIKTNQLQHSSRIDLIKIVDYYNSLSKRNDR
ncbi:hypothetical protein [uncultured Microscilla sp.]|uniref:hypothetical protein n=1 Tax=uncultured Microscilla sp. TaxID=432653 RepID=UPI00260297AC|nr:hypothetical protein [uncultured Microscilla sp.]